MIMTVGGNFAKTPSPPIAPHQTKLSLTDLNLLCHRQVIIVLTQLESSGGFSIAHRLTHRPSHSAGLHDWGPPGTNHDPAIDGLTHGLHSPRPI